MNTTQTEDNQAVAGQVERVVRPYGWMRAEGHLRGVTFDKMADDDKPLYDQAALDAAVAADRERWAKLRRLLQGAEVLFAPLCNDATAWNWLDDARAALAETEGPNAGINRRPHD